MKPILISILILPPLALGQNLLDPLTVQTRSASLTAPSVEDSRRELALVAGATSVVDPETYLTGRASTVADTFAYTPGVFAQSRFGSDEARLSIRGSGLQRTFHGRGVRVLQDGVPINLADGGFDFQSLDPLAASHIAVWRGANAFAYGSSTLGGAIDYLSKTGRSHPGGSFRLEAGSFDYLRARLETGFSDETRDFYASFSHHQQESFRDNADQFNQRLFTNFGWILNPDLETRFYLTAVNSDSELPGNLTKAELESRPSAADESFFGSVRYDNRRDYELVRLANKTTWQRDGLTLDIISAWTYKDLDHPITPFVGVIDQLSNDLLLGTTLIHEGRLFGRENRFRFGTLVTHGETDDARFQNILGDRGPLLALNRQTATNFEAFFENQLDLGAGFTGVVAATAAHNIRDNERVFTRSTGIPPFYTPPAAGSALTYRESYSNLSPQIGLRWDRGTTQVFANVSRIYEPPSFAEAVTGNLARDAQTGTSFEIGTRGVHRFMRWDLALYHAELNNELLTLSPDMVPVTINADDTTHSGVELGFEADLLGQDWTTAPDHRLVLRGAWTYGRFRFDDDDVFGDNRIAGLPPHLIRGELLWESAGGWYAGPTFEWVPEKSFIDHANTWSADPYALAGFKVGRRLESGFSWFVEGRNLFDETHAATHGVIKDAGGADQRQFLPGDGRSVFAGVEFMW